MTTRTASRTHQPSRTVLRQMPERVVVFLHNVACHPAIREAMSANGYTRAEHKEGWKLLLGACGYDKRFTTPPNDSHARAAQGEVATWARTHFRRLRLALARLHPDHVSLFDEILTPDPEEAFLAFVAFLERLSALPPEEASVRETLSLRGFHAAEEARLRGLVDVARSVSPKKPSSAGSRREARHAELVRLYLWYQDWAGTARAVITRRDHLILLGLAARARSRSTELTDHAPGEEQV